MLFNKDYTIECTWGTDPEFFVEDEDGKVISPHHLTCGTKKEPEKIPYFGGWSCQIDGMALEFNSPVYASFIQLQQGCSTFLASNMLHEFLRERNGGKPVFLSKKICHTFDEDVWGSAPDSSKELGCNPDFDAYTGEQNTKPAPTNERFRTVSGHIAIGWMEPEDDYEITRTHFEVCRHLVRDFVDLGCLGVLSDPVNIKEENTRRSLYGQPGAFRPKPFGVEWRAPSNYWCRHLKNAYTVFRKTLNSKGR
jgi:hypothetical protein